MPLITTCFRHHLTFMHNSKCLFRRLLLALVWRKKIEMKKINPALVFLRERVCRWGWSGGGEAEVTNSSKFFTSGPSPYRKFLY